MLSKMKSFLDRHKRKFIVSGLIIGSTVCTFQYLKHKLNEIQQKQTLEYLEQSKRMHHFESTEKTCNQAIKGLSSKLCDQIIKYINTNELIHQLRNNPENKIALWDEIKILSFTRLITHVYTSTMLVITLRIQLNLLGGYLYKDTTAESNIKISEDIRQNFLILIQYFLNEGLYNLIEVIEKKVRELMTVNTLTQNVTLADIEQLFWSLQISLNNHFEQPNTKITKYIFPATINETGILETMFAETIDMLESDDVSNLFSNNVSSGFAIAVDNISEFYTETKKPNSKENKEIINMKPMRTILNINEIEMPLAKLIPIVNSMTSKGIDNGIKPQSLSTALSTFFLVSEKMKILGANVYEVFSV